jgi:hypothetical protein
MTLDEVVIRLDDLGEDDILCVRAPWAPEADCVVATPGPSLEVPKATLDAGYSYFLEVHVAREVIGALSEGRASLKDKVKLLIHYAQNDAYPDWIYTQGS